MTKRRNSALVAAVALNAAVFTAGCGTQDVSSTEIPLQTGTSTANPETASVSVAATTAVVSPAVDSHQLSESAPPNAVCRRFLRELNRENVDAFEMLLTPAAMTVANRLDFHLPPVADPDSPVELSDPMFSTNREKLCYIDSIFNRGKPDQSSITWMLRRTRSGWRVAGMLIEGTESDNRNLLSFENGIDIQQIRDSLTEEVSALAPGD